MAATLSPGAASDGLTALLNAPAAKLNINYVNRTNYQVPFPGPGASTTILQRGTVVTSALANIGATSLTVAAIPHDLPSQTVLLLNGASVAKLSAPATAGDTSVAVNAIAAAIPSPSTLACQNWSGIVGMIQFSMSDVCSWDGVLQVFVDGEATPSISCDFGTLFVSHNDAHTGSATIAATEHIGTAITGGSSTQVSYAMLFPVPYGSGIVVKVANPTTLGGGGPFYAQVTYREGSGASSRYRLRSQCITQMNAPYYAGASDIPFFDVANNAGVLVWASVAVANSPGVITYLERPWQFFVDGESVNSFGGDGGEDFFGGNTGWFFVGQSKFTSPFAILTASNNTLNTTTAGVDLLKMHGGVPFKNRLRGVWGNKSSPVSSSASVSSCFLMYTDTLTPFAPTAPTNVAATQTAAGSVTVSWTAPASPGSRPITGYAVTKVGGATTNVGPSATSLAVTGLSNGSAQWTVAAINAVGTGAAGTSNSLTVAAPTAPAAPAAPLAFVGNTSAIVTFAPPASTGGATITGYTVTSSPGGLTATAGASATFATVSGLTNGTAYTFTVHATNSVGSSSESVASNSVTPRAADVTDSFNRANSASTLGTADSGQAWTATGATFGIISNAAYTPGVGNAIAYIDTGHADTVITATVSVAGTNGGIMFRQSGTTCFKVLQNGFGVFTAGGFSYTGVWQPHIQSGDVLTILLSDVNIQIWVTRSAVTTVLGSWTSATNKTATQHGLTDFQDTAIRWDAFAAA